MASKMTIRVGTIGQDIFRSPDGGDTWQRVSIDHVIHSDALVRTIVNVPDRPGNAFAGTAKGLYRAKGTMELHTEFPGRKNSVRSLGRGPALLRPNA